MFTGLIEEVGRVLDPPPALRVECRFARELSAGESVCVDGACLTVESVEARRSAFTAHLSRETMKRGIARAYRRGTRVNLERALGVGARLGGHVVTGHVDSPGRVTGISALPGGDREVRIRFDPSCRALVVEKGSICVSGVGLTVTGIDPEKACARVVLVPHTLSSTTAGSWRSGSEVNIEFDILGKYVQGKGSPAARGESSGERLQ
ncbi:riboflavin synthase [Candidatus Fermentibacterales bacterium]|nr:riboflavin synthase [Candidatus Fermentibacterales bacterium]